MQIIPVLDLKAGLVVRGVGGRRSEYRPVESTLTSSQRPVDVARAIRDHFRLREFYLADLDALAGAAPDLATYTAVRGQGIRLWVDVGLRDAADAEALADAGVDVLVGGLETLRGPAVLAELVQRFGDDRVLFSLDLKNGRPFGELTKWRRPDAESIAAEAVAAGVRRLLVLDLGRVGGGGGTGTEELCAQLVAAYPDVAVAAGGGVGRGADLGRLARLGVRAALMASALHDGRLRQEDVEALASVGWFGLEPRRGGRQ